MINLYKCLRFNKIPSIPKKQITSLHIIKSINSSRISLTTGHYDYDLS